MACAPNGNVNYNMNSDCPTILAYDFTSNSPSSSAAAITGTSITPGATTGNVTNPWNSSTANGVWQSSGTMNTLSMSFSATQAIDLEGLQLTNYWSTEPTPSASWDRNQAKLFVNGVQVAATGTSNTTSFRGWKGNTTTGLNSNDYWEFATNSTHTASNGTIAVNAGDTVRIDIMTTNTPSGNNQLIIDGLHVTGCVVPEPSSTMLLGLAGLGFIARRRRA